MKGLFRLIAGALGALGLAAMPGALADAQPSAPGDANVATASPSSIRNAERSVVRIIVLMQDANGQTQGASTGTGFVVAPGRVMTNNHVIEGDGNPARRQIIVVPDPAAGSQAVPGEVIRRVAEPDFALLSVPGLRAPPIQIATTYPERDATVRAFGFPGVTDQILNRTPQEMMTPSEPVVTSGSIALFSPRAPGGSNFATIFHTAFINPGNSGGPLMDACGRVIGINTWSGSATQSERGISVPQGQFIAIQSSNFASFLSAGGVNIRPVTDVCVPPLDPRIQGIIATQQAALAEERRAREAQMVTESRRQTLTFQLGIIAVIVIAGLVVGFVLLRRHPHAIHTPPIEGAAGTEAAAAEGAEIPDVTPPVRAPNAPLVVAGVTAGVLVLAVLSFFGINAAMGPRSAPATPTTPQPAPPPQTVALQGAYTLTCVPSSGGGQPITFTFDTERSCANDNVAYERTPTGYERLTFQDAGGVISRLTLSPDLVTYTRSLFQPSRDDYQRLSRAQAPACPAPGDQPGLASAAGQLRSMRTAAAQQLATPPRAVLTWRCTPTQAASAAPVSAPVAQLPAPPQPLPPQQAPEPQPASEPPQPAQDPGQDSGGKDPASEEQGGDY